MTPDRESVATLVCARVASTSRALIASNSIDFVMNLAHDIVLRCSPLPHGVLWVFGNGGSSADADHLVGELAFRYGKSRTSPIRAISLTGQIATMTATSNDSGYGDYPAFFLRNVFKPADMFLWLTTSGGHVEDANFSTANIRNAIKALVERFGPDASVWGIVGKKFVASPLCRYLRENSPSMLGRVLVVDSDDTATVQEVTHHVLHTVCEVIELYSANSAEVTSEKRS